MIMRTEKNKNYTVMGNYHLRDKELSLKAKGLLSIMLSLPDGWNFSTQGLAMLSSDGETAIRSTLKELEQNGYLKRNKVRINGKIVDWEYVVYEQKQSTMPADSEPHVENVHVDSGRQLNTKELNTKETNKDTSLEAPIPAESERTDNKMKSVKKMSAVRDMTAVEKSAMIRKAYKRAADLYVDGLLRSIAGTITIEDAFNFWAGCAMYRRTTRNAYLEKFLEAWQRVLVYHESDFYKRVRGADGNTHYMWQNVIAKYAENWNKGTPAERRENEAKEILE